MIIALNRQYNRILLAMYMHGRRLMNQFKKNKGKEWLLAPSATDLMLSGTYNLFIGYYL